MVVSGRLKVEEERDGVLLIGHLALAGYIFVCVAPGLRFLFLSLSLLLKTWGSCNFFN
uniref:Transmembrane protein n=1 Tax=Nelumbo nucifera TaxID=4432 RepID=A0A822Y464_NELNU|nr:TPA_asm: hypothetical protein HUJ06_027869 [Nelumbo nucifera]